MSNASTVSTERIRLPGAAIVGLLIGLALLCVSFALRSIGQALSTVLASIGLTLLFRSAQLVRAQRR